MMCFKCKGGKFTLILLLSLVEFDLQIRSFRREFSICLSAQCLTVLRKCFCYLNPLLLLQHCGHFAKVYFLHRCRYLRMFLIYNQTCKSQGALSEAALGLKGQQWAHNARLVSKYVLFAHTSNHKVKRQPRLYFCLGEEDRVAAHKNPHRSKRA